MDEVPVERVKEYQTKLTEFLSMYKADLLQKIVSEKTISDDLKAELKDAADAFKQTWR
jgi:F-type H+/Na+-transporting ATPase subunit alpha